MMENFDMFEEEQEDLAPAQLTRIKHMINTLEQLQQAIENTELLLKAQKADAYKLSTQHIPDAMASLGLSSFVTEDGTSCEVSDIVSGSLPKDPQKRHEALQYLESHEGGELIRTELIAKFAKGEAELATQAMRAISQVTDEYELQQTVHPSSLKAWVRERLREGQDVAAEKLGVFVGSIAKLRK